MVGFGAVVGASVGLVRRGEVDCDRGTAGGWGREAGAAAGGRVSRCGISAGTQTGAGNVITWEGRGARAGAGRGHAGAAMLFGGPPRWVAVVWCRAKNGCGAGAAGAGKAAGGSGGAGLGEGGPGPTGD